MGLSLPVGTYRCHERNANDERCTLYGEHQTITNTKGQRAIVHETKFSLWSVPMMVVITRPLEDQ